MSGRAECLRFRDCTIASQHCDSISPPVLHQANQKYTYEAATSLLSITALPLSLFLLRAFDTADVNAAIWPDAIRE